MKKVYCKDCKYFRKAGLNQDQTVCYSMDTCLSTEAPHIVIDSYYERIEAKYPSMINTDNNCKWFEAK